eukprot:Mrub_07013.p1 GENE.Mrub_07013~~Mrub_07013.p1  ORF type:complete len:308 (+),score=52.05 Mrub_07013:1-924(+)
MKNNYKTYKRNKSKHDQSLSINKSYEILKNENNNLYLIHKEKYENFQKEKLITSGKLKGDPYLNMNRIKNILWNQNSSGRKQTYTSATRKHLNRTQYEQVTPKSPIYAVSLDQFAIDWALQKDGNYFNNLNRPVTPLTKKASHYFEFNQTYNQLPFNNSLKIKDESLIHQKISSIGKKYFATVNNTQTKIVKDKLNNSYIFKKKVSGRDLMSKKRNKVEEDDSHLRINSSFAYTSYADLKLLERDNARYLNESGNYDHDHSHDQFNTEQGNLYNELSFDDYNVNNQRQYYDDYTDLEQNISVNNYDD